MTTESIMRDALLCAFLEGGSCAWEGVKLGITPEQVATAADDYVYAALPNVMAALAQASPAGAAGEF